MTPVARPTVVTLAGVEFARVRFGFDRLTLLGPFTDAQRSAVSRCMGRAMSLRLARRDGVAVFTSAHVYVAQLNGCDGEFAELLL
jgi:hypothetical protein